MAERYNIWGLDPGTTNFGYACTLFGANLNQNKPLLAGKIESLVANSMDNLPEQYAAFLAELIPLFKLHPPSALVIERFMNRGKFSGDTGEYVSMMIALIIQYVATTYPDCYIRVAQPGVWKQAFNRSQGWKSAGQTGGKPKSKQKTVKVPTPIDHLYAYTLAETHILDAWLLTHYGAGCWWEERPFSNIDSSSLRAKVERMERVAGGKKSRKRKFLE